MRQQIKDEIDRWTKELEEDGISPRSRDLWIGRIEGLKWVLTNVIREGPPSVPIPEGYEALVRTHMDGSTSTVIKKKVE